MSHLRLQRNADYDTSGYQEVTDVWEKVTDRAIYRLEPGDMVPKKLVVWVTMNSNERKYFTLNIIIMAWNLHESNN